MNISTTRKRDSTHLQAFIPKLEEEGSIQISNYYNSQSSSDFKRCDDVSKSILKSHQVLTFSASPRISTHTKRIKLNEYLSYCEIPISQSTYLNNTQSTILRSNKVQKGRLYCTVSTVQQNPMNYQKSYCDCQSYIKTFPDYRIGRVCNYRKKGNVRQDQNCINQSLKTNLLEYQNLVMLFSNQHFSAQVIDSGQLQMKCLNFVKNYTFKSLKQNETFSVSPLLQQIEFSSLYQNGHLNNQHKSKTNINDSKNLNQQQQTKLQLEKNHSQMIDLAKEKMGNNINQNIGQYILLNSIQYRFIKNIIGKENIEFSQRTISKVINKFILFLKGDYRTLKYYDLDDKLEETAIASHDQNNLQSKFLSNSDNQVTNSSNDKPMSFEIFNLDLFKLLDEQDMKESSTPTSSQKGSKTIESLQENRNDLRNTQTSNSTQFFREKTGNIDAQPAVIHPLKLQNCQEQSIKLDQSLNIVKIEPLSNLNQFSNVQQERREYQNCEQFNRKESQFFSAKKEQGSLWQSKKHDKGNNNQNVTFKNQDKQKQTLFNLSKYLMHLIIEFLSEDHLEGLNLIPGLLPLVQQVIKRIKKKGQRSEHSQTYYYNHSHYNCLFLLLNVNSIDQIQKSDELWNLHQYVFEITDFNSPYNLTQINIIKTVIAHLVLKQFKVIRSIIYLNKQNNPERYQNYKNYMITKLQYFERVYQGIKNLKKGTFLVRF